MTEDIQKRLGLAAILAGNLVPFYGIAYWGWDIFSVFFLYWAENVIIGFYVWLMMLAFGLSKGVGRFAAATSPMGFFTVHYGIFCMGHLAILTELFGREYLSGKNFQPVDTVFLLLDPRIRGFFWTIIGLAIAQAFQCLHLYRRKYSKVKDAAHIMFAPYGRIMVLHVAILVGGLAAQKLGQSIWALAVLVALKTLYDVAVYNRTGDSHGRAQGNSEKTGVERIG